MRLAIIVIAAVSSAIPAHAFIAGGVVAGARPIPTITVTPKPPEVTWPEPDLHRQLLPAFPSHPVPLSEQTKRAPPRKTDRYLPPPEYDRPYRGHLVLTRVASEEAVRVFCPGATFGGPALGCARRLNASACQIVMAYDRVIIAAGLDPDVVYRHEVGHCNGWPNHHPDAR